jgi:hypothetical protein
MVAGVAGATFEPDPGGAGAGADPAPPESVVKPTKPDAEARARRVGEALLRAAPPGLTRVDASRLLAREVMLIDATPDESVELLLEDGAEAGTLRVAPFVLAKAYLPLLEFADEPRVEAGDGASPIRTSVTLRVTRRAGTSIDDVREAAPLSEATWRVLARAKELRCEFENGVLRRVRIMSPKSDAPAGSRDKPSTQALGPQRALEATFATENPDVANLSASFDTLRVALAARQCFSCHGFAPVKPAPGAASPPAGQQGEHRPGRLVLEWALHALAGREVLAGALESPASAKASACPGVRGLEASQVRTLAPLAREFSEWGASALAYESARRALAEPDLPKPPTASPQEPRPDR